MKDGKITISIVQFHRDRHDGNSNRFRAFDILAGIENTDIVCMPEVWMGGVVLKERELGSLLENLSAIARENRYTLLTGGLFVERGADITDVCHVLGPEGVPLGEQQKIFPSGAVGERKYCRGGRKLEVFDTGRVKFGVAVCVDMFYPEIIRSFALRGAEIVFNPANIPEARNGMWRSLVRTRAAENTVFAAYANNTGTEYADGRKVAGGSLVAGPDGIDRASAAGEDTVLNVELDLSHIETQRERWPYLSDASNLAIRGEDVFSDIETGPARSGGRPEPD